MFTVYRIEIEEGGRWFPQSGWLDDICEARQAQQQARDDGYNTRIDFTMAGGVDPSQMWG